MKKPTRAKLFSRILRNTIAITMSLVMLSASTLIVNAFDNHEAISSNKQIGNFVSMPATFSEMTEKQLSQYLSLAQNTVEAYYLSTMSQRNEVVNQPTLNTLQTTDIVASYMSAKLRYDVDMLHTLGYEQNYIDGSYELSAWKILDDNTLLCTVFANVTFQYSQVDFLSSFGSVVQVVVAHPRTPQITDFYVNHDYFDTSLRGYDLDLSLEKNRLPFSNANETENRIAASLDTLEESIAHEKQQRAKQTQHIPSFSQNTLLASTMPFKSASHLSNIMLEPIALQSATDWRSKICTYACNNAAKTNPAKGNSSVPYGSFSLDCTNFVSHALLAGGFKVRPGSHGQENCWFYISMSNRSSSWSGVENFFGFINWNTSTTQGPRKSSVKNNTNQALWQKTSAPPEIIQIKYNTSGGYGFPNYGHTTLVTKTDSANTYNLDLYVTWRSGTNSYGVNKLLPSSYPAAPSTTSGSGGHLYRMITLKAP